MGHGCRARIISELFVKVDRDPCPESVTLYVLVCLPPIVELACAVQAGTGIYYTGRHPADSIFASCVGIIFTPKMRCPNMQ